MAYYTYNLQIRFYGYQAGAVLPQGLADRQTTSPEGSASSPSVPGFTPKTPSKLFRGKLTNASKKMQQNVGTIYKTIPHDVGRRVVKAGFLCHTPIKCTTFIKKSRCICKRLRCRLGLHTFCNHVTLHDHNHSKLNRKPKFGLNVANMSEC